MFGGSPYVLSVLDYAKTLEENIQSLLINQNSLLRTYIESIMLKEVQKAVSEAAEHLKIGTAEIKTAITNLEV